MLGGFIKHNTVHPMATKRSKITSILAKMAMGVLFVLMSSCTVVTRHNSGDSMPSPAELIQQHTYVHGEELGSYTTAEEKLATYAASAQLAEEPSSIASGNHKVLHLIDKAQGKIMFALPAEKSYTLASLDLSTKAKDEALLAANQGLALKERRLEENTLEAPQDRLFDLDLETYADDIFGRWSFNYGFSGGLSFQSTQYNQTPRLTLLEGGGLSTATHCAQGFGHYAYKKRESSLGDTSFVVVNHFATLVEEQCASWDNEEPFMRTLHNVSRLAYLPDQALLLLYGYEDEELQMLVFSRQG